MGETFTEMELSMMREHMRAHAFTLALVRTERAPGELGSLLEAVEGKLGARLSRTYSSPMSEFSMAELRSGTGLLVMVFVAGERTELLSLSETDEIAVRDLEENIHYSNFYSEIMRHGL